MHFRGVWPLYWDHGNVCSSQRGSLNIPHSALLRNRNWFDIQQLETCARWAMWNAWLVLPVRFSCVQHTAAVSVNDLIICQVFPVYNTGIQGFSLSPKWVWRCDKLLLYFCGNMHVFKSILFCRHDRGTLCKAWDLRSIDMLWKVARKWCSWCLT